MTKIQKGLLIIHNGISKTQKGMFSINKSGVWREDASKNSQTASIQSQKPCCQHSHCKELLQHKTLWLN